MHYLDTNILIYACVNQDESKLEISQSLIRKLAKENKLLISPLSLQEFIMKTYSYTEAREQLSQILNIALQEEVIIKKRGGERFSIICKKISKSPFDIPGIKSKATTKDILDAVRESREGMSVEDSENI